MNVSNEQQPQLLVGHFDVRRDGHFLRFRAEMHVDASGTAECFVDEVKRAIAADLPTLEQVTATLTPLAARSALVVGSTVVRLATWPFRAAAAVAIEAGAAIAWPARLAAGFALETGMHAAERLFTPPSPHPAEHDGQL